MTIAELYPAGSNKKRAAACCCATLSPSLLAFAQGTTWFPYIPTELILEEEEEQLYKPTTVSQPCSWLILKSQVQEVGFFSLSSSSPPHLLP